jgi:hypothetical protein
MTAKARQGFIRRTNRALLKNDQPKTATVVGVFGIDNGQARCLIRNLVQLKAGPTGSSALL